MSTDAPSPRSAIEALRGAQNLTDLYPVLNANRMTAGWHKIRPSLWPEPRTEFSPMHWRYAEGKLALDQAGRWMSTEQAERRNLILYNPVGDNDYATLRTIIVAYQMIRPGEHARAHWHTPNALRFVLDAGEGVYTVVDGVELPMRPGDVLLTPGDCWHSHYNHGDRDAYWIDFLDVPLVHLLEPMFVEHYPGGDQPVTSRPAESEFMYPANWIDTQLDRQTEPVAQSLAQGGIRQFELPSASHIPTLQLRFTRIEAGKVFEPPRSTANRVYAVARGRGHAQIGSLASNWSAFDVLAAPTWHPIRIAADEDTLLFEVSDEAVMRAIGMFREGRPA